MLWLVKYLKETFREKYRFYLLVSILISIIFLTQFNYWFGDYNRSDLNTMKEEIIKISTENEKLLIENYDDKKISLLINFVPVLLTICPGPPGFTQNDTVKSSPGSKLNLSS